MADFYGFNPSDWLDDFFSVECRFRSPPGEDLLRRLGQAAGRFRQGSLGLRFSGPFAVIDLLPHPRRERDALFALQDLLSTAAGEELVEAVVLNSIQEDEGSRPREPGPDVPGSLRAVDPALPEPTFSPIVEAATAEVLAAEERRLLEEFLEHAAAERVRLREIDMEVFPEPPEIPAVMRQQKWQRYAPGIGVYEPTGPGVHRISGVSWPAAYDLHRFVVVRGERALIPASTVPRRHLQDRGPTELLLLDNGSVRHVFRLPDNDQGIESVAWLDDEHAVVGSCKRTIVVSLADGREVAAISGGGDVTVAAGGQVVVSRAQKRLRLLGWWGDRLTPLAGYAHPQLQMGPVVDDLPTVRVARTYWTTEGLKEALAAARPAAEPMKREKSEKSKKKATARPGSKPQLVQMPYAELAPAPADTPLTADELDAFAAAGLDVRPASPYKQMCAFRLGDIRLGVCADGVAWQRGLEPHRLIRWTSPSGYKWQLSRLRLTGERVFASDANLLVEASLHEDELQAAFDPLKHDAGYKKDLRALDADTVALLMSKGVMVIERRGGHFVARGFQKITKPTHFLVAPSRGEALVGTEAKDRLVLVDLSKPKKVAAFTEDADELRLGPDGWQVADPRRSLAWWLRTASQNRE